MKTATFPASEATSSINLAHSFLGVARILNSIKSFAEERRLRMDLAELDPMILKDMGVGDDEIDRVRACETFTPRAWRT